MSLLPRRNPIDIEFVDLSYVVPTHTKKGEKKLILKNVCGQFRSGRLTAIMGPSGAGKTTLMNATAAYRLSNVRGTILTNGSPRNDHTFRKQCCYIMQDDHLLPHLTVNEAMSVAARLKLSNTIPLKKKKQLISEILDTLSLNDCASTRTGSLSGGQRKRLSIALELVNNPPVMFFDEPTSGLDSQNSYQCINLLKTLALEGRTIICTIHQPSARLFEKFDYLYALSNGECIYRGAVPSLLTFLSSLDLRCPSYHNPADFLIEVATIGDHSAKMTTAVLSGKCQNLVVSQDKPDICSIAENGQSKTSVHEKDESILEKQEITPFLFSNGTKDVTITVEKIPNGKRRLSEDSYEMFKVSFIKQFVILLGRNYKSIMRDSMFTKLRLLSHIVVGLLIGTLYYGIGNDASQVLSNNGFVFCSVLFTVFAGMMPTLLTFPLEMKVFLREHHNCWYSLKSYYMAKTMADFPFQIIYPSLYVGIVYFMTDQPFEVSRFVMFTSMSILTSLVAQSLAMVIGAFFQIQEATFCAPIVTIPILLFSGFFVKFSTIPPYLRWLTYISYMRYAMEGSLLALYDFGRPKLHCPEPYCHFKSPRKILQELDIDDMHYWVDFVALCVIFIVLRISGYYVLRWKLKSER